MPLAIVAGGVAEEARTRRFASPALAGFALIAGCSVLRSAKLSIRKNTQPCSIATTSSWYAKYE
jgi:hypothetical protein